MRVKQWFCRSIAHCFELEVHNGEKFRPSLWFFLLFGKIMLPFIFLGIRKLQKFPNLFRIYPTPTFTFTLVLYASKTCYSVSSASLSSFFYIHFCVYFISHLCSTVLQLSHTLGHLNSPYPIHSANMRNTCRSSSWQVPASNQELPRTDSIKLRDVTVVIPPFLISPVMDSPRALKCYLGLRQWLLVVC